MSGKMSGQALNNALFANAKAPNNATDTRVVVGADDTHFMRIVYNLLTLNELSCGDLQKMRPKSLSVNALVINQLQEDNETIGQDKLNEFLLK